MHVKLNILDGSAQRFSKVIHLPCIIGRSRLSNIAINHPLISRQHCEIYEDHGLVMVRDLGSLNGTYYKEAPIRRSVHIEYGESFAISTLNFVIEKADDDNGGSSLDDIFSSDNPETEENKDLPDIGNISDIFK